MSSNPLNPSRGKNVTIWPLAKLAYPENIVIGDESMIDDFALLYASGEGIQVGKFCHITAHCTLFAGGLIEMGDFSAIGPNGVILGSTDDYEGGGLIGLAVFGEEYRNTQMKGVKIGRHVHIGAGVVILPGVELGDGCSIGAGSVVTKSMPEWTICYGNPCVPRRRKPKEKQLQMEKEFLEKYKKGEETGKWGW